MDKESAIRSLEAAGWQDQADALRRDLDDDQDDDEDIVMTSEPFIDEGGDEDIDVDHAAGQAQFHDDRGDEDHAELWRDRINDAGYDINEANRLRERWQTNASLDDLRRMHDFYDRRDGYDRTVHTLEKLIDAREG